MDELEKINGKREIFDLLLKLEKKINIPWDKSFYGLSETAAACSMELIKIGCIKNYRNMEEKTGKRRKPSKILNQEIKRKIL